MTEKDLEDLLKLNMDEHVALYAQNLELTKRVQRLEGDLKMLRMEVHERMMVLLRRIAPDADAIMVQVLQEVQSSIMERFTPME